MTEDMNNEPSTPAPGRNTALDAPASQPAVIGRRGTAKRERPTTVLELVEYAYAESGRRLPLARKDLQAITVDPAREQAEIDAVRRLAAQDPLFAVPPSLLAAISELKAPIALRRRVLDLVLVAVATDPGAEGLIERWAEPSLLPPLTAEEVSRAASRKHPASPADGAEPALTDANRERRRVNSVITFALFKVLREGLNADQFMADMSHLVWNTPRRDDREFAAVLATARNHDALSQMARHFETHSRGLEQQVREAQAIVNHQRRRAEDLAAEADSLTAQLDAAKLDISNLNNELQRLGAQLSEVESGRVVDKSHLVQDYEALRTQVVRVLSTQVELLSDGLHALRNDRNGVAEEFVDRALVALKGQLDSLRLLEGGQE